MCFIFLSIRSVLAQVMQSIHRWHKYAPEVISESLNSKISFGEGGGACPQTPKAVGVHSTSNLYVTPPPPKSVTFDFCPSWTIFLNETCTTLQSCQLDVCLGEYCRDGQRQESSNHFYHTVATWSTPLSVDECHGGSQV